MTKRSIFGMLAGAAAGLALAAPASAIELRASAWAPPSHPFVAGVMMPWAKMVEDATGGSVKVKLLPQPVASAPGHLDAVRDGLIDITFISTDYYQGRFEFVLAGILPNVADTAEARSIAFQRMYDKFLSPKVKEYEGLKLVGHWATGPGIAWTTKKQITKAEDFNGLKMRMSGGMSLNMGQALGATPVVKPANEVYELLSGGIVDGVFFPKEAICSFKLDDHLKNATLFSGGLYASQQAIIINEATFKKMTPKEQEAINKLSGEVFSKMAGKVGDDVDATCWKKLTANNFGVTRADAAFMKVLNEKAAPFVAEWKQKMKALGVDADAAYAFYNEQLAELNKTIRPVE